MFEEELRKLLLEGKASPIVKPRRITADAVEGPAANPLQFFDMWLGWNWKHPSGEQSLMRDAEKYHQRIEYAINRKYIAIRDNRITLIPVVPQQKQIIHIGILDNKSLNTLREIRVFGNPSVRAPTYLKLSGSKAKAFSMKKSENKILLTIDSIKLLERRNVFIDPEALQEGTDYQPGRWDYLGETFFVCGGIPYEAIIHCDLF